MIKLVGTDGGDIVRAEITDSLSRADWEAAGPAIENQIEKFGKIRLLIDARNFSGWDDFEAARAHFDFVRSHHDRVTRVAIVTGRQWQYWLTGAAGQFVDAEMRAFDNADMEAAEQWLRDESIVRGISVQWDAQTQLLSIIASGKITGEDFRKVLQPVMEDAAASAQKIGLLVDISGWTALNLDALWEDLKFSASHFRRLERIALVGDQRWLEWGSQLAERMLPDTLRVFSVSESGRAREWAVGDLSD